MSRIGHTAGSFLRLLVGSLRWKLVPSLAVAVALAFAEGAGLLLLIPLLASLDLDVEQGPTEGLARLVQSMFQEIGLQPTLPLVLVIFLFVSAAHALLYRAHLLIDPALEQEFTSGLRRRLYAAIASARWPVLVRHRTSELIHGVTRDMDRVGSSAFQLISLLTEGVVTSVYLALAAALSLPLTVLVGVLGLGLLWTQRHRTGRSAGMGDRYDTESRHLFGMASEAIAGIKVAKILRAERRDVERFRRHDEKRKDAYLGLLRSFAQDKLRLDLSSAALICGLLLLAVEGLQLRGPGLLLLIFVFVRVMPRLMGLQEAGQTFVSGLPTFATVMRLIEMCEAAAEAPGPENPTRIVPQRAITIERASFSYEAATPPTLQDVTLTVPAGRTTGIVGPSGAGKSTLADLLLGLLQPTHGRILVDDVPLDETRMAAWRAGVAYVPQDSFLLHDTIRANLLWARPGADETDMWHALERAAAASFVRARDGLDTVVGERGVRLSGGERQRLALARALLTNPAVLVLDEATSALDSFNEAEILRTVRELRGRITCIIITHRLSTIRDADLIHVIENGRLVESGSWEELVVRNGPFARLHAAQRAAAPARA